MGSDDRPTPALRLQEGNRVLESIARQETLHALLAFSDLHEQIRNRRMATGGASDRDLFETERFILDEVLQLICDRVQAITQADGIVVALAEGSAAEKSQIVCRAAAGPLAIGRGVRLTGESEFLQDCLESGRILRCDDCEADARLRPGFCASDRSSLHRAGSVARPARASGRPAGVFNNCASLSPITTFVVSICSPSWFFPRSNPRTRIGASIGCRMWLAKSYREKRKRKCQLLPTRRRLSLLRSLM